MHEQISSLVPRDLPPSLDRILLRLVDGAGAATASSSDSPSILVGYHVLIAAAHHNLL